jgi:hypothetical protein
LAAKRARIAKGEWRNGPLPSVEQLQQERHLDGDTVLRTVQILRNEGLTYRQAISWKTEAPVAEITLSP